MATRTELFTKKAEVTQQLRNMIDKWEIENKKSSNDFDAQATGDAKRKCLEMEAELDRIADAITICDKRAAADKVVEDLNQPFYDTRKGKFLDAGDADYTKRFWTCVAQGNFRDMGQSNRDMTNFVANASLPTVMENYVLQMMYSENVFRQISNVSTIDSKRTLSVESTLPTSQITYEVGSITASDQAWGSPINFNPIKFTCATALSKEFIEDAIGQNGIGSGMAWIAQNMGRSLGRKMEEYYGTGTGAALTASAGQPQGIAYISNTFTNNTLSATTSANHVGPTGDDLLDTFFKLGAQYRQGSVWLMNDTVLKSIRKLKTVTSGLEYIFKESSAAGNLVDGVSGTLLGRPIYVSEFMPTLGVTVSTINCVLGDFKRYFQIVDRAGMDSFIDPYSLSLNQKTNMIVSQRTDSKITNQLAFSVFRNKAS